MTRNTVSTLRNESAGMAAVNVGRDVRADRRESSTGRWMRADSSSEVGSETKECVVAM